MVWCFPKEAWERAETAECKGGRLFADDTAPVADSEKLCGLVSEFGRVCERRKLRVNVGSVKS